MNIQDIEKAANTAWTYAGYKTLTLADEANLKECIAILETHALQAANERERCLRILRGVNNSDNPMTANDCADLIASGRESF
jgi:hypothetical protein